MPIQRRIMLQMQLTSGVVLVLTCAAFLVYELIMFRQGMVRQLQTVGQIVASNSTAALAFDSQHDAEEILMAFAAEKHIVSACVYDQNNKLFVHYPQSLQPSDFPATPGNFVYQFKLSYLEMLFPIQQGSVKMGTLYIKSNTDAMRDRLKLYAIISLSIILVSIALAYILSHRFQKTISAPILSLTKTAQAVADNNDYSVRAKSTQGPGELQVLITVFNQMLTRIQTQNDELNAGKERLENIVQGMGDAYVSLDATWRYTFANQKALQLTGLESTQLIGNRIWDAFPSLANTVFEREYRKTMEHRIPTSFETFFEGTRMWLEIRCYPYESGIAIFYTDITKYKTAEEEIRLFSQQLEQKVRERTEELEYANKELESFSYSVSHDLRAPLRSMHGYMNIFAEDYMSTVDEEGRRLIGIILSNAKRMGQLIDDLLEFSKLGRKELLKSEINMKEMVDTIWTEQIKTETNRSIVVSIDELPHAKADNATIKQVWINLISNALKYTRNNPKTEIRVGFTISTNTVTYFVKDNGAGFDMQYYDKLFGVFQRLHSYNEFEGTGVGLAIVHRIIVKHGGKIWAEAKPDQGATFFFSLPL